MGMLLRSEKNWKSLLTPQDEERLNGLLERTKQYRGAYMNAEDVKLAQMWCTMLQIEKENSALEARVRRLEWMLNGMLGRAKMIQDTAAKRALAGV
jgi:hypothetical protein